VINNLSARGGVVDSISKDRFIVMDRGFMIHVERGIGLDV
jgi:hypothetical protein